MGEREPSPPPGPPIIRWFQLAAGIVGMIAVANFQYSWTLFVLPLQKRHGWSEAEVQHAFFLFFVPAMTWFAPLLCYLADRFGPRPVLLAGGFLSGLGWCLCSAADSLAVIYAAQALSGLGSGVVYGISMGSALKWFPDRRGLAAGLMAAAFGTGSVLTILPIEYTITIQGYEAAFLQFGLVQGLVVLGAVAWIRFPRPGEVTAPASQRVTQTTREYAPREMLRSPTFWLLYVMMTIGAIPGLLMIGEIKPMAVDFHVADVKVTLFWATMTAVNFAMFLDRFSGGLTRPVFGWFSDHVGRETAIFCAFALEGTALFFLIRHNDSPVLFVLMSGLAFFGWGAILSLFPALNSDLFGRQFASANYGLLYTAKGVASLLVAGCMRLQAETGSWAPVFTLMIACDFAAAFLALFALRPLHRRWLLRTEPGK